MRDQHLSATGEPAAVVRNNSGVVRDVQARENEAAEARALVTEWRAVVRKRVVIAVAIAIAWTAAIEARLVYLQVVQRDDLAARAERQRNRTVKVPAKRGELLDRSGRLLAYSVDGDAVFAEPAMIADKPAAAAAVCAAIPDCTPKDRAKLLERLGEKRAFTYLWRRASPSDATRVVDLKIRGVGVLKEDRRYYPNRELAAHVLGYVNVDNVGIGGLETTRGREVSGQEGVVLLQADAKNNAFARVQRPPTVGASLELTLDSYLQFVAERELEAGVAEFGAAGGTAIIMEPHSGDILALANYPTFNPNAFQGVEDGQRRNRAVEDVYEPGSTFKIVTASAALEEKAAKRTDRFDVSSGSITFGSRTIRDVHTYNQLSFDEVIVKSSNVGAIKIGLRLGPERLGRYVSAFGFGGYALGRQLPGETAGIVWKPESLSDSALASVSMGYQVGVTPVQMATAASTIANGGELVSARIVRATIRNQRRTELPRRVVRRVISTDTAAAMTEIMEQVVAAGTAKSARMEGYTIAGKTGTAAKLERGRYSKSNYNASFIGFLPSRKPAVTIVVVIDSPHGKGFYGGAVAAPIFKRLAEATMRHLGIAPNLEPAPKVLVASREAPASVVPTQIRTPSLLTPIGGATAAQGLMPDLRGLGAREAVRALAQLGIAPRMIGDGIVVEQQLEPGLPVERGATCALRLERRLPVSSADAAMP